MRRTLRELIPQLEIDWLLPAWLLVAILGAFTAETATIGLAVGRLYSLWSGWAIGGVIASAQAIGSMMWSRAAQHNAQRVIVYKWLGTKAKGNRRRVENKARSEPTLNVAGPATISILAGVVSAWLAGALYATDGLLTPLDVALAIAAPAGSVSAALLNGVFAYGESAVAHWQEENSRPQKQPQASVRPTVRPHDRPQVSGQPSGRPQNRTHESGRESVRPRGRPQPATRSDTSDTSPALAGHLTELQEKLATQRATGARSNGSFQRKEVEALLGISSSHAKNIVAYGLEHGVLEQTKRHHYQFTIKQSAES